jgi:hypothetical protein
MSKSVSAYISYKSAFYILIKGKSKYMKANVQEREVRKSPGSKISQYVTGLLNNSETCFRTYSQDTFTHQFHTLCETYKVRRRFIPHHPIACEQRASQQIRWDFAPAIW